jgi:hypothetical protein
VYYIEHLTSKPAMTMRAFLEAAAKGGQWDKGDTDFHAFLPLYFEAKDAGLVVGTEYRSREDGSNEVLSFLVTRLTDDGAVALAKR